ncbi:MAG TPA: EAL domain-containing response regulator [Methylomirabilota bacterium]|nr:EAL domain-containing response regulator [Methylomirabilota bacterium]
MDIAELRFLVAEDHDFQRRTLVRMLTGLGAREVLEAADGRAALAMFRDPARPVHIILCDLDMPEMDGMEFLRHVGATGAHVSVILSSALDRHLVASVETMTTAYGMNLLGAIEKPATPQKLRDLIARHGRTPARRLGAPAARVPGEEAVAGLRAGQLEPFFQPKVDLASGAVAGAEALARWRNPERGIMPPDAFVGALEAAGELDALTWVMLERSAAAAAEWQAEGLRASVSVNLSLTSLSDPTLADRITDTVRRQGLETRAMILEITESAAMTDVGRSLENLARLRVKGFGLSIDDYGTGYSSMQQLARIPFTELKLDQSFVTNCATHAQHRAIIESCLDMARRLKLKTVAEGVETHADWTLLRDLGCGMGQGYFIAEPMSLADFPRWAREWTPPA